MKKLILSLIVSCLVLSSNIFLLSAQANKFDDFYELRSEHFFIHYQEGVSRDYVDKIKNVGEKFYRVITQEFNLIRDKLWLWENRAKIFIAKDKEAYLERFNCSSWSGACVNYLAKIIYTYPNQNRFNSIFIHELTHIILHEYVGRGRFSLWLDEGIATYIENKHDGGSYRRKLAFLKRMIKQGKHIPLSELSKVRYKDLAKKPQEYVGLFYIESFSIIHFFVDRYGKHGLWRLLSRLRSGSSVDQAMRSAFPNYKNFDQLEKQWIKFYLK